jgi:hypothetical protein
MLIASLTASLPHWSLSERSLLYAAPGIYYYTSSYSGAAFTLNTAASMQADAEITCQSQGGHLAAYLGSEEQEQVERGFTALGGLIPVHHGLYWLGVMAEDWPNFYLIDTTLASSTGSNGSSGNYGLPPADETSPPGASAASGGFYQNWADEQPDDGADPPELCAVAVHVPAGGAWLWDDANCGQRQIFACRLLRKLLHARAALS